ncbi:MAG: hypothetical protein RR620_01165 [Clostridium sp.]
MRNDEKLMVTEINEDNTTVEKSNEVDEKALIKEYEDILGY